MTDAFMEYRDEFESYRDDAMKDIKQMSHKKDKGEFVYGMYNNDAADSRDDV